MGEQLLRFSRLATILLLTALLTSRVTLVLHEFVGHGAVAAALGSTIEDYHLYVFAGGYIDFERAEPYSQVETLCIFLGGIAVELLLGGLSLAIASRLRRDSVARMATIGCAAVNLVHAGYYLAAGTFHGYGDGAPLHRMLGAAHTWFAIAIAILLLPAAFLLARALAAMSRRWLAASTRRAQLVLFGAAVGAAGAAHAGLAFAELGLSPSPAYETVMRHQSDRDVSREVAEYARATEVARGEPPSSEEIARVREELREKHEPFPFDAALLAALAAVMALGAARSRSPAPEKESSWPDVPAWRAIAPLAAVTALSLALVLALRALG